MSYRVCNGIEVCDGGYVVDITVGGIAERYVRATFSEVVDLIWGKANGGSDGRWTLVPRLPGADPSPKEPRNE